MYSIVVLFSFSSADTIFFVSNLCVFVWKLSLWMVCLFVFSDVFKVFLKYCVIFLNFVSVGTGAFFDALFVFSFTYIVNFAASVKFFCVLSKLIMLVMVVEFIMFGMGCFVVIFNYCCILLSLY